jgi:hypothetical protein
MNRQMNVIHNNNNSIRLFTIYMPSQQLQGQLQTQYSAVIGNYIMDKYNIKSSINYRNTKMQKKTNGDK